MKLVFFFLKV